MSRRVSLPGADELFRTTGGWRCRRPPPGAPPATPGSRPRGGGDAAAAAHEDAPQSVPVQGGDGEGAEHAAADVEPAEAGESRSRGGARRAPASADGAAAAAPRKRGRPARRPSGRERHDEKITVYVSAEELMDLEHARLVLRGEHGLAVDRGRIVREAVAVVLADLESRGDASILVRRLRGR